MMKKVFLPMFLRMLQSSSTVFVSSGVNVLKLFTNVILFSYKARALVREKHSSLLLKYVNFGQKSFIKLGPGCQFYNMFCNHNHDSTV